MIPEIGIMVGAYIITRMMYLLLLGRDAQKATIAIKIFAAITLLIAGFVCLDLFIGSLTATTPSLPNL
jgi:hypothetical protein